MTDTLNSEQAAQLLHCSQQFACELARTGRVPAVQLAGQWLFLRGQLIEWLAEKAREEQTTRQEQARIASTIVSSVPRLRGRPRKQVIDVSQLAQGGS